MELRVDWARIWGRGRGLKVRMYMGLGMLRTSQDLVRFGIQELDIRLQGLGFQA